MDDPTWVVVSTGGYSPPDFIGLNTIGTNILNTSIVSSNVNVQNLTVSATITNTASNSVFRTMRPDVGTNKNSIHWFEILEVATNQWGWPTNGPNQIFKQGFNFTYGGTLFGTTNGASYDSWEANWETPSPIGESWVERHGTALTTNSFQVRANTFYSVVKSPTAARLGFTSVGHNSDEFQLFDRWGNQYMKIAMATANTGAHTNGVNIDFSSYRNNMRFTNGWPVWQMLDTGGTYRYGPYLSTASKWVHGDQAITNEFRSAVHFNPDNTYSLGANSNTFRPYGVYVGTEIFTPLVKWTDGRATNTLLFVNAATNSASLIIGNALTNSAGTLNATRVGTYRTIFIDAAACVSNLTSGGTFSGATFNTEEFGAPTNRMIDQYIFADAVTNAVQFKLALPLEWNLGTIKAKFFWSTTNAIANQTNVWAIQGTAISDDDPLTADWGTEQIIRDNVTAANDLMLSDATPAITIGGTPVAGDLIWFRVKRLGGHADDAMSVGQAKLLGIWLQYLETIAEQSSW